jgi:hypothetical protein
MNPLDPVISIIRTAPPSCVHFVTTFDLNSINASKRQRVEVPDEVQKQTLNFDFKKVVDVMTLTPGTLYEIIGLDIAGLANTNTLLNKSDDTKRHFYCRQDTVNLVDVLQSMTRGAKINGPPGVGKSTTVWLWICNQVNKGKSVLWIHLAKSDNVIHLKPTGHIDIVIGLNKTKIAEYVERATDDIVVVDGVTKEPHRMNIEDAMFVGLMTSKQQILSVSSVAATIKIEELNRFHISSFVAEPWSLEDYYSATNFASFFNNVEHNLVVDGASLDKTSKSYVRDVVDQKFYYAGFSARWMFEMSAEDVIKDIDDCLDSVLNIMDVVKGMVGSQNANAVNHLTTKSKAEKGRAFTSNYICKEIVQRGDDAVFHASYSLAHAAGNPSLRGWILELDFIHQIQKAVGRGLEVTCKDNNKAELHLEVAGYINVDTNSYLSIKNTTDQFLKVESLSNYWFLPEKWNQAGYDLVSLQCYKRPRCKKTIKILRFIQVTGGQSHGLKLHHFNNFVAHFGQATGETITRIEIFVVLPNYQAQFAIPASQVSGESSISNLYIGASNKKWSSPANQVKIIYFKPSQVLG